MGLIVDIVPNHMGVGGADNAWWLDVLEWGEASPYAAYFDINWDAVRDDLKGRVLLPVLGDQYGAVLENGEIALRFDPARALQRLVLRASLSDLAAVLPGHPAATAAPALSELGRRISQALRAAGAAAGAPTRAAELKRRLAELPPPIPTSRAGDRRGGCGRSPGDPGARRASGGCTGCSKRSPTASRSGASRPRRSTTAAFSTSTILPGCASNCRSCSRRRTG